MPEPTTTTAASIGAGGYAAYKLAVAIGLPAGLVAILVMLWVQPKSSQEWGMALISTVVASVCGGAWAIRHFGLQHLASSGDIVDLMAFGGIFFACGLPGWVIVRAAFAWADKRRGHALDELVRDAKDLGREVLK